MSITSGFYESRNHDREYFSYQFGEIFDGIITDGVYSSIGDKFIISASEGMNVLVGSGRAWFGNTWVKNDADYILEVAPAESVEDRIDAIIIETNKGESVRKGDVLYVKGTPSSIPKRPQLENTLEVTQHAIGYIYVKARASSITQSDVTNTVGTSECPFVTGVMASATTDELVKQWADRFEIIYSEMDKELNDRLAELQTKIDQVVQGEIPDGSVSSKMHIVLPTTGWVEDPNGVHITLDAIGVRPVDEPIIDIDYDKIALPEDVPYVYDSWSVYRVKTLDGKVEVYSTEVPKIRVPIKLICIRK